MAKAKRGYHSDIADEDAETEQAKPKPDINACPGCFQHAIEDAIAKVNRGEHTPHNADCEYHDSATCSMCLADPRAAEFPGHNVEAESKEET